jgi:hypothetical protein
VRPCILASHFRDCMISSFWNNTVQHQSNGSDVEQRLRCLDITLIVLREATVEAKPGNAAFDNPRETGNLEGSLFALDDVQAPAVALQLSGKLATLMASISNYGPDGRPERCEPSQQSAASPSVRHVGWFNAVSDWKAKDINQDMAFSSLHPLVPIKATHAALSGCLHRLAVHDDDCRVWLSTRCQASLRIERAMQQHPNASNTPPSEVTVHRWPGWKVAWQLPPLAASAEQVDDPIEDGTDVRCAWTAAGFCKWYMRRHQRPRASLRSEG